MENSNQVPVTVITARSEDGLTKNWRIHKPIEEIVEADVNKLE